jgi:hypothetical protein
MANLPFAIGVLNSCPISLRSSSLVFIEFSRELAILLKVFAKIPISSFEEISILLDKSPFAKFESCLVIDFRGERSLIYIKILKLKQKYPQK